MKKLAVLALLALEMMVSGCGTTTNGTTTTTTSASGKWQAVMAGGDGQAGALNFVTAFTVGSGGGNLDITSFSFLTTGPCFGATVAESGSATLVTSSTNAVTGTLSYSVSDATSTGSVLILDGTTVTGTSSSGTLHGGVVTGTWNLTGPSGCTGGGTFTMTQTS